jgi:hypothetical protein
MVGEKGMLLLTEVSGITSSRRLAHKRKQPVTQVPLTMSGFAATGHFIVQAPGILPFYPDRDD